MQGLRGVTPMMLLVLLCAMTPCSAMASNASQTANTAAISAKEGTPSPMALGVGAAATETEPGKPEQAKDIQAVTATPSKVAESPRPQTLPGAGQIVISLALVLGLVLLLAFFYKKMQLKLPGHKHFRIVATMNIGQRERLLVIEIQGKQRVLGVTAQQINFLFDLESPLTEEKLASDFHTQLQSLLKK
jgi:flagellar protein FliO/FliZ